MYNINQAHTLLIQVGIGNGTPTLYAGAPSFVNACQGRGLCCILNKKCKRSTVFLPARLYIDACQGWDTLPHLKN